jgi:formiminotetrahydrofolate cyclodeaminase
VDKLCNLTCGGFSEALASSAPVPGGGAASAYVGVLAASLGLMVGSLTVGKKKYAGVEADVIAAMKKLEVLRRELISLADQDAESFLPLSKAYSLPKETPEQRMEKAYVMESALRSACGVPMEIMRRCCEIITLQAEMAWKGSVLAVSDVGAGVVFAKSALMGASLNIFINARAMADREYAEKLTAVADDMLKEYCPKADNIFELVRVRIG